MALSVDALKIRSLILFAMDEQIEAAHMRMLKAENEFLSPDFTSSVSPDIQRLRYHESHAAYMALKTAKEYLTRVGI